MDINWYYLQPNRLIGQVGKAFANGPGHLGLISGRVIPKTLKMVLDTSLLNTQHYKVRIKGKVEHPEKGVVPSPTPRCSSYWKGILQVALDCGRQQLTTKLISIETLVAKWKLHEWFYFLTKRTHKHRFPLDPFTQTRKCWTTSKNFSTSAETQDVA